MQTTNGRPFSGGFYFLAWKPIRASPFWHCAVSLNLSRSSSGKNFACDLRLELSGVENRTNVTVKSSIFIHTLIRRRKRSGKHVLCPFKRKMQCPPLKPLHGFCAVLLPCSILLNPLKCCLSEKNCKFWLWSQIMPDRAEKYKPCKHCIKWMFHFWHVWW